MKDFKNDLVFLAFIILIVIGLIIFFNIYGPVKSHNLAPNYKWMAAFANQFSQGELYPRWLYESYAGAGSPAFYFYAPMPFWITSLVDILFCFSCTPSQLIMASPTVMMGLASISCYYFVKSFSNFQIAFAASLLYFFLPYHFIVDFWIRSSWGELVAYIFMPLILLKIKNADRSRGNIVVTALCYAGLLYSHLPTALLFSPVLLLYACLNFGVIKGLQKTTIIVLLGMGFASAYIIPALVTQEFIYSEYWALFQPEDWLWFSGKYSLTEGKFVGLPIFLTILIILISISLSSIKEIKQDALLQTGIISSVVGIILITDLSQHLWQHIGLLKKVQFPWRMGSVFDLAAVILFAIILRKLQQKRTQAMIYSLLVFLLVFGLIVAYSSRLKDRIIFKQIETIEQHVAEGFEPAEYRTKWLASQYPGLNSPEGLFRVPKLRYDDLKRSLQNTPAFSIIDGDGIIMNEQIEKNKFHIKLQAETEIKIRFRRFYYPGWHLLDSKNSSIEYPITVSPHYALIEASLPAGIYSLSLVRKPFFVEGIGIFITFLSVLFCSIIVWRKKSNQT